MSDEKKTACTGDEGGDTAVLTRPASPRLKRLPPWQVLLHNDDVNDMMYVVDTIQELTSLKRQDAMLRTRGREPDA